MSGSVSVKLNIDTSSFERALRRVNEHMRELGIAFRRIGRNGWRSRLTLGEQHIDRIARDCAARRLDVATTARRLMVAADIAAMLDDEERAA